MEMETKRQWMQSFDGRIRVGPEYQAMIPPFCKNSFPSSHQNDTNSPKESTNEEQPSKPSLNKSHSEPSQQLTEPYQPDGEPYQSYGDQFVQSYAEEPLDDSYDADITSHLKFASREDEPANQFASDIKSLEASYSSSDKEF
uniref:ELM2 domain containing protein, putative n=1 Tax=Theileria annulata TaxID=5874 RepID=A0A3B0MXF7_THEAN